MHCAVFKKLIAFSALAFFAIAAFGNSASATTTATTDVTVFPPANMTSCLSTGAKFLSWAQGETGTSCSSGQDVFNNALPNCAEGQQIVRKNGVFACQDPITPGTCGAGQVLTYTASGFTCVDIDNREVPTCAAGSFLTFDGTNFVCTGVPTVNLSCPAGKVLQGIANSQPVCVDGGGSGGSGASCTVYKYTAAWQRVVMYCAQTTCTTTNGEPLYATSAQRHWATGQLMTEQTTVPDGRIFYINNQSQYTGFNPDPGGTGGGIMMPVTGQCQDGHIYLMPTPVYQPPVYYPSG